MKLPPIAMLGLLLVLVGSALGAAVFGGALRALSPSPLVAEVRLQSMTLPSGFSMDNAALAANLVAVLQDRVRKDVGLTVLLGEAATKQLREAALPRLVNTELMTRMIENMPAFAAMTSASRFRSLAEISVRNRGDVPLEDVAITIPGLILAEPAGDAPVVTTVTASALPAARLGALAPGGSVALRAWLDAPLADVLAREAEIKVGARGRDGTVLVYGHRGWSGEDFETVAWGRWLVWALLVAAGLGSAGALGFAAYGQFTSRWRRSA